MDCPFCGKEMKEGRIPSGYRLRWLDADDAGMETEEVPLNGFFGGEIPACFCPDCRRVVLSVPEGAEKKDVLEAVQQTIGAASEKLGAMREQWTARRDEEKERRKKKEFGKKDPWEL